MKNPIYDEIRAFVVAQTGPFTTGEVGKKTHTASRLVREVLRTLEREGVVIAAGVAPEKRKLIRGERIWVSAAAVASLG